MAESRHGNSGRRKGQGGSRGHGKPAGRGSGGRSDAGGASGSRASGGRGTGAKGSSARGSDGRGTGAQGSSGRGSEGRGSTGRGSGSKGSGSKGSGSKGSGSKRSGGQSAGGKDGSAFRRSPGKGPGGPGSAPRPESDGDRRNLPPRRSATPRPADLPRNHEVTLPRGVRREIERTAPKSVADDVVIAVSAATERADEDPRAALAWLRWARDAAPRSVSVHEALAITAYLAEEYAEVVRVVRAYRRLTGREDQNHLLADALRAQGHPTAELADVVEAMDDDVPAEHMAEGRIVWAAALGDGGDPRAGLVVLQAALDRLRREDPSEAHVRVLYVAGDLAQRAGLVDRAREFFREALEVAGEDPWDVQDRLDQLG